MASAAEGWRRRRAAATVALVVASRGGGFGGGGARGNQEDAQRMRNALRDEMQAPEHLIITQSDATVIMTAGDGRTTRLSTDGRKIKDESTKVERKTKWDGGKLVSEINGLGQGKITETYTVDEKKQLHVSLEIDGSQRKTTVNRVYDADSAGPARGYDFSSSSGFVVKPFLPWFLVFGLARREVVDVGHRLVGGGGIIVVEREGAARGLHGNRAARTFVALFPLLGCRPALRLGVGPEVSAPIGGRRSPPPDSKRGPPKDSRGGNPPPGRGPGGPPGRGPENPPGPRSSRARASLTASGRPLNA